MGLGHSLGAVVLTLALAACTPAEPAGTRSEPARAAPLEETPARPEASTVPPATGPTEPLVLVVHATRPAPRITSRVAQGILDGRVRSWRALDGSRAPIRLVRGDDPDARRGPAGVLRRVSRDDRAVGVLRGWDVTPRVRAVVVDGVDPLQRPEAYPLRAAGADPGPVVTLTAVGGLMLGRRVAGAWPGGAAPTLRPWRRLLQGSDLTLGSLETTLSRAGPPSRGADSLSAPRSVVRVLADAGFDAVSLATDHVGDFGPQAVRETIDAFQGRRTGVFGAGATRTGAGRPLLVTREGVRFGFLGFNAAGGTPTATSDSAGAMTVRMPPVEASIDDGDLRFVERRVTRLDAEVDVVVVVPHWGAGTSHVADPAQRSVARILVAAGADLVLGSHPQGVQGLEPLGTAVVAHSLGGFVDDENGPGGGGDGVVLTAVLWGPELKAVGLSAYRLGPRFIPRRVRGPVERAILRDVWENGTGAFAAP